MLAGAQKIQMKHLNCCVHNIVTIVIMIVIVVIIVIIQWQLCRKQSADHPQSADHQSLRV